MKETIVSENQEHLLDEFARGIREEADSPFNAWVTGVTVGHEPSPIERRIHFVVHGGLMDYRSRFFARHPEVQSLVTYAHPT